LNDYSDSIGWPTKDPQWISKIIVQSLITIIPIVGLMALLGWMLAALDNLRNGRRELPGAGFAHLGRGVTLFLVFLVYGIAIAVVFGVIVFIGFLLAAAGSNNNVGVLSGLGALLIVLAYGILIVAGIAFYFLMAPIIVATERGGFGGGINFRQVFEMARSNPSSTLFAGLFILVGHLIGSVGSILCGIGVYLTIAYGYAVMAAVVAVYERQSAAQQLPPPQPAAPAV
jgi:Protein of unknown function (DUF4013)